MAALKYENVLLCASCGITFYESELINDVCPFCGSKKIELSKKHEFKKYIKSLYSGKIETDYTVGGYTVDCYLPDIQTAFVFNITLNDYPYDYWQKMSLEYKYEGIRLIHIYEPEFTKNRKEIDKFIKACLTDYAEYIEGCLTEDDRIDFARNNMVETFNLTPPEQIGNTPLWNCGFVENC